MITASTGQKRILFLDDHVPFPELGVGYPRARRLVSNLCELGHALTFVPLEVAAVGPWSPGRVLPSSVELVERIRTETLAAFLGARIGDFDLIFVSRPTNMRALQLALRELGGDSTRMPILYDAEAIFSARDILRMAVDGICISPRERERLHDEEMALARAASHVATVNECDAETFRFAGCRSVQVLGDGLQAKATPQSFAERSGLLFVGALDEAPSPNVDALVWFVENVLPHTGQHLVVAGRCAAARVKVLVGPAVRLLGMVDDLEPLYNAARVLVAPHRYAAGIPNKVLEASASGLPCVISELLCRQLGWSDGVEVLTAATPQDHARAIKRLCSDQRLWLALRGRALAAIERDFSPAGFRTRLASAIQAARIQ